MCARRDKSRSALLISRLYSRLETLSQRDWVISTAQFGALGDLTLVRHRGQRGTRSPKPHISTSERYVAASRSLLGLVAFERVVVLFIVLAGVVQLFRLGGHMAERAGFLFFSLYTRAWRMKGSSSQQCRETERTLE